MNFRIYNQYDQMDCGAACLQMIAKHYSKFYSLQHIRRLCHISREGVSLLGISEAAESIGLRTNGVKITLSTLAKDAQLPCIIHWDNQHFVVCYKISRSKHPHFYIADPSKPHKLVLGEKEMQSHWCKNKFSNGEQYGFALLLEPTLEFFTLKADDEYKAVRDLVYFSKYILPYKKPLSLVGISMIIGMLIQVAFPIITQATVDIGIKNKDINFIALMLVIQLAIFSSQLLTNFIKSRLLLHINARIDIALLSDFLIKLMRMPIRFFDSRLTGDLLQRIGDHSRVKSLLMNSIINILFAIANFVVFSILLGIYQPIILFVFLAGNALYIIWALSFLKYRKILDIRRFNQSAKERSAIIELIQGMQEIKLNNCCDKKRWKWESIQAKLFKIDLKNMSLNQLQQSVSILFTQATYFIISFLAAKSVIKGEMTLGMMMSVTYILGQLSGPINEFLGFSQSFQDAKISMNRLNEIHQHKDENLNDNSYVDSFSLQDGIHISNVTFSYSGAERDYALQDINLHILPNTITAIVGMSGSGKTTLIKILQGIYTPMHGAIYVDGIPLHQIRHSKWRDCFGAVSQDSFIFSDTILNNIAVGDEDVDYSRLRYATKTAEIEDFIMSLPLGYQTKIGMEGNGISTGQRQRILIARAIYKNPDILFLDEATNSLDATNERLIIENLNKFYKGKTVVIVAHRLSTVKYANNIVVMEKGRIVETGNHAELYKKQGKYWSLVENQLNLDCENT